MLTLLTNPRERPISLRSHLYYSELRNLTLDHIDMIIELNQIGATNIVDSVMHLFQRHTEGHRFGDVFIKKAKQYFPLERVDKKVPFPPSVSYSFESNENYIPQYLLSNHESFFSNRYYHSIFDKIPEEQWLYNAEHFKNIAQTFVDALVEYIGVTVDANSTQTTIDGEFVFNLTICMLSNTVCPNELGIPDFIDDKIEDINYEANDILSNPSALSVLFDVIVPKLLGRETNCSQQFYQLDHRVSIIVQTVFLSLS